MTVSYQTKIITLWGVFLLGLLFHTQLGLMPLFQGQSVVISGAHTTGDSVWILWLMLGFFVLPLFAMVATLFDTSRRYRRLHFGGTVFYSVMNFLHVIADVWAKPIAWYQITLMIVLLMVGLVLNRVAFQWMQERTHERFSRSASG